MGVGRVEVSGQEDGIEGSLIAAESNSRRGDRETRQFASNLGSKQSSGMKGGRLLAQVLEVLNFPTSERRGILCECCSSLVGCLPSGLS